MGIIDSIDLNPNHLATVKSILAEHVPECEVRAFGSRATWTARDYSDLDLAIVGEGPLDWRTLGRLKEAFEESALPMRVDVLDWHTTSESFREVVERGYAILQKGTVPVDGGDGSNWSRVNLHEVTDLRLSSVDKKSKPDENSVRLCNYTDVYKNSFIHADMEFMQATATEREIEKCALVEGDVVITKDSEKHDDIGVPALVREDIPDLVCGYHLAILRPRSDEVDGAYLFYALSADDAQEQFHSYANGVTRFGLRKADIGLVEIPHPPLHEQRAIAHVLETLDDKIELNRRMNETLEQMARALFKSWFVDFDPVRAKMEGRWRRGESLSGLPANLYDLFPDRLVPSELGEIPQGWQLKRIEDVAERVAMGPFGSSIKVSTFVESGVPIISGQHLKGTLLEDGDYRYIAEDHAQRLAKSNVQRGDIVFTHAGNIGQVAYIPETSRFERYVISQRQFYLRCDTSQISPLFVLHYFKARQGQHQLLANTSSTGVPSIARPVTHLRSIHLSVPTQALCGAFHDIANFFHMTIGQNTVECNTLTTQRDALLSKLVSGEVRVPDTPIRSAQWH